MIIKCLSESPLPVYGNGANVRDWLFVEDHAQALIAVLERGTVARLTILEAIANVETLICACGVRNLGSIEAAFECESYTSLITYVKDRPGHDYRYAIDSSKIQRELQWRPATTHLKLAWKKPCVGILSIRNGGKKY